MKRTVLGCALAALGFAAPANAMESNVVYILDGSNSMWGQVGGTAKIETAKTVLKDLVSNSAVKGKVGLVAYGHRDEASCTDIQLMQALGAEPAAIAASIDTITPKGKTPISASLEEAAAAFGGVGGNNNIVLISDGVETCEADPCATAGKLAAEGVQTRVHVVGFDVNADEKRALECIADAGNGEYFEASDAESFKTAMAETQEVIKATPPAPEPEPEPTAAQFFFDDFDGGELAGVWEVKNANLDAYIVEESAIMSLNNKVGGLSTADGQNIVVLNNELPKGDFDAIASFSGELKTGADRVEFGLWKDAENYMIARVWSELACCGCSNIALTLEKSSNGEKTQFTRPLRGNIGCGGPDEATVKTITGWLEQSGATLTLQKRGRNYSAALAIDNEKTEEGKQVTYETDTLSSLRLPGQVAFSSGKFKDAQGETLVFVDSVEIVQY